MRILLIAPTFGTITHGPARMMNHLWTDLPRLRPDVELHLLTEDPPTDERLNDCVFSHTVRYPARVEALHKLIRSISYRRALRRLQRKFRFDVLVFAEGIQGWATVCRGGKKKPAVILLVNDTAYTDLWPHPGEGKGKQLLRRLYRYLEGAAVRRASMTVVPSNYALEKLCMAYQNRLNAKLKVGVLRPCVVFAGKTIETRSAPKPEEPLRILFLKSNPVLGGLDILVRAMHLLTDLRIELTAAGFAPDRLTEEMRQLTTALPTESKVIFPGYLGERELQTAFARAHLLCLPSRRDALPFVVLEALAAGLPVAAAATEGVGEALDCGRSGLLLAPTAEAFATALRDLATDRAVYDRWAAAAARGPHPVFSRTATVTVFCHYLDQVTGP
ncbi:MAG: glycosyltransferase family 4 protein [Saprospiraceae bacterium]